MDILLEITSSSKSRNFYYFTAISCANFLFLYRDGNFSVKKSREGFDKVQAIESSDQAIEQTINREQKGHGGIKGFSNSDGTVQRLALTSHVVSKGTARLEDSISLSSRRLLPKELGTPRKMFNDQAVESGLTFSASLKLSLTF